MDKVSISELHVVGTGLADIACVDGKGVEQRMLSIFVKVDVDNHTPQQRELVKLFGYDFDMLYSTAKSAQSLQISKNDFVCALIVVDEEGVSAPDGICYDRLCDELRKHGVRMFLSSKNQVLFKKLRSALTN